MRLKVPLSPLIAVLLAGASLDASTNAPVVKAIPEQTLNREVYSFDEGWRFHLGDITTGSLKNHADTYASTKAGNAGGAAGMQFDDSTWRVLNLPHDWVIEGAFDKEENRAQGYRPRGIAWYRKSFELPASDRGKHLELQIDGVGTHCTVWVNGLEVHHNNCGYTGFSIDITPYARYGEDPNTIAIRVDADAMEGWWYEGGGMYRHTRLVKRPPLHIATDGIFASPVKLPDGTWEIPVQVTLENSGRFAADATVSLRLITPSGKDVATDSARQSVPPLGSAVVSRKIKVTDPVLWSVDAPKLYTLVTTASVAGGPGDIVTTRCGFRTIRFDAAQGFFLNGKPLKIKGTCNHMDHAGVGVAVPDSLWDFRIRKLKEMGSNAYRCSHNPPPAEFLDACDRLGMLVMDENRNFNCSPEGMEQLRWMVRRDRNHPSVILWSVFNEEPMQGSEQGYEMVRRMTAAVKELDTNRPVTAAMNDGHFNPVNVSSAVDVVGFNYQQKSYDRFHELHPDVPIMSSEDTSALMTRGEYLTDTNRNVIAAYDDDATKWGATHHDSWREIEARPFVAGGFVWTGFDYRGEPTPHTWPTAGSFFGCMDLCGFPKTGFFIHQAEWIKEKPVLEIVPHWNWKGSEGKPVRVMALTNAKRAELFLNGATLGEKEVDPSGMVRWDVPYAPGTLEVVARSDGKEVARKRVETTGDPVALELVPDRKQLAGDGSDAMPVTIRVLDAQGRPVPDASPQVHFSVKGPIDLIGLGNGDPNCHEPEQGTSHSLFNGLGQAIIRSIPEGKGEALLLASSPGLKEVTCRVQIQQKSVPPSIKPVDPSLLISRWKQAQPTEEKPDPTAQIADNDMNSWSKVRLPRVEKVTDKRWHEWRCEPFRPFEAQIRNGGVIRFGGVTGSCEIWLDGVMVAEKTTKEPSPVEIPFAPGEKDHQISILFHPDQGEEMGIASTVRVMQVNPAQVPVH